MDAKEFDLRGMWQNLLENGTDEQKAQAAEVLENMAAKSGKKVPGEGGSESGRSRQREDDVRGEPKIVPDPSSRPIWEQTMHGQRPRPGSERTVVGSVNKTRAE